MIFSVIVWCILRSCIGPCTGNGRKMNICHIGIFISHKKDASVGCVGASVRIVLEIAMEGGGATTIDIAFIVSIQSGSPYNF
jgi:hypothetical protein